MGQEEEKVPAQEPRASVPVGIGASPPAGYVERLRLEAATRAEKDAERRGPRKRRPEGEEGEEAVDRGPIVGGTHTLGNEFNTSGKPSILKDPEWRKRKATKDNRTRANQADRGSGTSLGKKAP